MRQAMIGRHFYICIWFSISSGVALIPWQQAHALSLREAISHTIKNNPEILASKSNLDAVEKTIDQAAAGYLPTVDMIFGVGKEGINNSTTRASKENNIAIGRRDAGVNIGQMIYDGNNVENAIEKAKSQHQAASYNYQKVALSLAGNTSQIFLEVLKQEELNQMTKDNVLLHQKMLEMVRTKASGGAGSDSDVQQTESRLALISSNHVMGQAALLNQKVRFERLVDLPPKGLVRPAATDEQMPSNVDAAIDVAIKKHPAIQIALAEIQSAKAETRRMESGLMPRIDFEVTANNNENQGGVGGSNRNLTGMLWLKYNLFRGWGDTARISETTKRINQATENRDQIQRGVVEEIKLSWNSFQASKERVNHLKKHVSFSKSATESYHDQFELGKRTLLDVLNSENELYTARSALINEQFNYLQGYYKLLTSMGTLNSIVETASLDNKQNETAEFFRVADTSGPYQRIEHLVKQLLSFESATPQPARPMLAMVDSQESKSDAPVMESMILNKPRPAYITSLDQKVNKAEAGSDNNMTIHQIQGISSRSIGKNGTSEDSKEIYSPLPGPETTPVSAVEKVASSVPTSETAMALKKSSTLISSSDSEQKNPHSHDSDVAPVVSSSASSAELIMALKKPKAPIPSSESLYQDPTSLAKDVMDVLALDFVPIHGGCFAMGMSDQEKESLSDDPDYNEYFKNAENRQERCVKDFEIGRYEVTVKQFREFVKETGYYTDAEKGNGCQVLVSNEKWERRLGTNWKYPGFTQQDNHPVVCISWNDAQNFIQWLNIRTSSQEYRLPTEAEWEFVTRSGTQTIRYWGDEPKHACQYANVADDENWVGGHDCKDGTKYTSAVGRFKPNQYGVHDLFGNAREWTCSEYKSVYDGTETQCITRVGEATMLVDRGGSWYSNPEDIRASSRDFFNPSERENQLGFRLVRVTNRTCC